MAWAVAALTVAGPGGGASASPGGASCWDYCGELWGDRCGGGASHGTNALPPCKGDC